MLFLELLFISFGLIVQFTCLIYIYRVSKRSPVFEWKILVLAFCAEVLFHFFWMISALLSFSDQIIESSIVFFRIGWLFVGLAFLLWCYAFFLPTFKASYRSLFELTLIAAFDFSLGIVNFTTADIYLNNGFIKMQMAPTGYILLFLAGLVYILPGIRRDQEINKIQEKIGQPTSFWSILKIFNFLFLLMMISSLISMINGIFLPGFTFALLFAIQNIFFTLKLRNNEEFFFVTPVQAHATIIVDQRSGLVLFSENYQENLPADDLLGGLLTALNLSLMETLQSTKSIEQIVFGDKVIQIAPGDTITTFLIVSDNYLITRSITKYITKTFEKTYKSILLSSDLGKRNNTKTYESFTSHMKQIKQYMPL